MKRATFYRPCVKIEIRCAFCSWVNDFLCTQIVLKITITWWVLFEWLSLDPQQKQRYDWRFSSKCFVSFRSWDTFLLSYWIDFLPGIGRTKNMNKVFRLKRFVNMAFRHCPVGPSLTKYTPSVNILSNSKHWIYEHTIGAAAWRVFECGHKQFTQSFELEISV